MKILCKKKLLKSKKNKIKNKQNKTQTNSKTHNHQHYQKNSKPHLSAPESLARIWKKLLNRQLLNTLYP